MQLTKGTASQYSVKITPDYKLDHLKSQWLSIEQTMDVPFFMTWSWISNWLKTYSPQIVLTYAYHENKLVGIGIFTLSKEVRRGFIKAHQYRLHQMGDPKYDQIWMEYNDFLCHKEHLKEVTEACINALMDYDDLWDEIIISMIKLSRGKEIIENNKLASIILFNPRYSVDLNKIPHNTEYLSTLTSNTRYQVRHSIRLYENLHGSLKMNKALTTDDALELFRRAGEFHVKRWSDSGYKNEKFLKFHQNLIQSYFHENNIGLYEVSSGKTTIAILYFHIVKKTVYFYLQGINYEPNQKLKPGLVAHTIMTQHFHEQGMHIYDYMGGYSQYKCQLASQNEDLVTVRIQKPRLQFSIEKLGQKIKNITKRSNS